MRKILCTPCEAIKYRHPHTDEEMAWAVTVAISYDAQPIRGNAINFYKFVADVFSAGRISGVREERARRKKARA